jgi:hypothetical protein
VSHRGDLARVARRQPEDVIRGRIIRMPANSDTRTRVGGLVTSPAYAAFGASCRTSPVDQKRTIPTRSHSG